MMFKRVVVSIALWGLVAVHLAAQTLPVDGSKPSVVSIKDRLREIHETANPYKNSYLSRQRVPLLKEAYAKSEKLEEQFQFLGLIASNLLNAGDNLEAAEYFHRLKLLAETSNAWSRIEPNIQIQRAMCYLRLGEVQNCLLNHNAESCLFPIEGGGIHLVQEGSNRAIPILTELLESRPKEISAIWLLNLAYMTLGQYPDRVPRQWLIPPDKFQSDPEFPEYPNIASAAGLDVMGLAGGSIVDDFNNDGFLDVMASSFGLNDPLRLFLSQGDGTFLDQTEAWGLMGEWGGLNIVQTDFNNDGFVDVLVLRGAWFGSEGEHPNSLLMNRSGKSFENVTISAGLYSERPTQTAAWFDFNNDGWLDLFIGNESKDAFQYPCELYRNNADGTFTECAEKMGLNVLAYVKGVTAGDYNNDGWIDLYLSCLMGPNRLFRNNGASASVDHMTFTEVAEEAGVGQPERSFPTWFWDYDNDGWLDLFVANYSIQSIGSIAAEYMGMEHPASTGVLYRNNRDGTFADVSRETGLDKILYAMGSNYGDLDNDGYLDFYIGTGDPELMNLMPNRMFRNDKGTAFQEVTHSGRFGHLQKGHGVSFADLDNDGDQDVYTVLGGAYPSDVYHNALFHNPGHGNHWVKFRLIGRTSNRLGVGARITLTVNTPEQTQKHIHHLVSSGGSFGANPISRVEMGLGPATRIEQMEIRWPATGETQVFRNLEANQFYQVAESKDALEKLELTRFEFSMDAKEPDHSAHSMPFH